MSSYFSVDCGQCPNNLCHTSQKSFKHCKSYFCSILRDFYLFLAWEIPDGASTHRSRVWAVASSFGVTDCGQCQSSLHATPVKSPYSIANLIFSCVLRDFYLFLARKIPDGTSTHRSRVWAVASRFGVTDCRQC